MLIASADDKFIPVVEQDLVSVHLFNMSKGHNFRPVYSQKFCAVSEGIFYMLQGMITDVFPVS